MTIYEGRYQACFWGMSVSMTVLMGACGLRYDGFANGMMYYAFALVVCECIHRKRREKGKKVLLTDNLERQFRTFSTVHFWTVSVLMTVGTVFGFMGSVTGFYGLGMLAVTVWSAPAAGLMAVGITILAMRGINQTMQALHSIAYAVFFQYAVFCMPIDFVYQVMAAVMVTGMWFLMENKMFPSLWNLEGDCIYTVCMVIDTAILLFAALFSRQGTGEQYAASAGLAGLTYVGNGSTDYFSSGVL